MASARLWGIRYNPDRPIVIETASPLNPDKRASAAPVPARRAFSSFSNGDFRIYFLSSTAAMRGTSGMEGLIYRTAPCWPRMPPADSSAGCCMNAPNEIRRRVIGVFSLSAMGMRTFSGLSVGILGASVGIHNSLGFSAAVLFVIIAAMFAARYGSGRRKEGQ
jgi:hypothetical protein